jgi:phosphoglycolate phosphatase (TIGR01487 family)
MIKAVVCDLDGTITDCDKRIGLAAIEALRRVQDSGVICMLASGNVLPITHAVSIYLGFKGPCIAENGALVEWKEIVHQLQDNDLPLKAYAILKERMPDVERLFSDRWRVTEVALKRTVDPEKVRIVLKDFPVKVETTGFAIHLMSLGNDKFMGLKKACELLGIETNEVAAFGDSDNDEMMLASSGVGIAVGNGSPAAKKAADFVATAEFGDGVVEGLKHLGLL